jgi:hypothetical protein
VGLALRPPTWVRCGPETLAEQESQNDGGVELLEDPEAARDASADETSTPDSAIGRIALKQVRVTRAEAEARAREEPAKKAGSNSPLNRLVPYLDLFCRLNDEELSRLARTPISAVETLRQQVDEVNRVLARYVDLLPRLSDEELIRLTGGTPKTIRFWRLCQPRNGGDVRGRADVPQPSLRETSAVRSVVQAYDEDSAAAPTPMHIGESGTVIMDQQHERPRRD